ncbi:cytochrome P450 [Kitasatospora viridis]|uniref:Cytochrome P450 n=1 Tax=Kitasatospora viridis TaxID=281105 RepID=A0A561UCK2_9ACTN|nr:cytochrome P450 [Kitasatospora viridis]TWF97078.1 cytochrome P450 [Kitasatospora viridis]
MTARTVPRLSPGEVARFAADPFTGMLDALRKHGPVVGVGYGSQRSTFFFGPQANSFVFANPELFSWRESFEVMLPVLGQTALLVTDGEEHRRRRHLVLPAFHRRRIDGYVELMAANTVATIGRWTPGTRIDLYRELRSLIRRNTIETLYGSRLAAQNDAIGARLQTALDATDLPLGLQLFLTGIPNPITARAKRARRWVAERVQGEIDHRRRHAVEGRDGLTALLEPAAEGTCPLDDSEIQDQVISLMVAGYETTSAAMAWVVHSALSTPGVWERARVEVRDVLGTDENSVDALDKLDYVDGVVQEALRLHPPVVVLPRVTAGELEFEGVRLAPGARLAISPYVTHRMAGVWPEPDRFLPERWQPDHPLHRPATPSTYLPFGGGRHRCIGAPFATAELKTVLVELLRRTELTPAGEVTPVSIMAMRPRRGVPVIVRRRKAEGEQ